VTKEEFRHVTNRSIITNLSRGLQQQIHGDRRLFTHISVLFKRLNVCESRRRWGYKLIRQSERNIASQTGDHKRSRLV